jgi:hypothetical protein
MGGTLIAPTNTTTLFTAGASGSRIEIIRITQTASTTAAGILNFFVARAAVFYLVDQYTYGVSTLTTTSEAQPIDIYYSAFELKSGDTVAVVNTISSATGGNWACLAFGGDF